MRRWLGAGGLMVLGALSMGAKGGGCSADYAPGDGSSAEWPTGPVPTPSAVVQPMTCEWLEGDNCWKQLVARSSDCRAGVAAKGQLASDRASCSYTSGAEWEFGGALDTPAEETTQFPVTDWRIVEDGEACMTGKILGIGKTLLDVEGEVAVFENPTLTTYRVTCSDGTTYGNDQPGTCETFGAKYLARETPGVLWTCTTHECEISLWGGETGETPITTCAN